VPPLLSNRCQVAIKQEATAGTAETLAAGNVILTTEAPSWEPDPQVTERQAMTRSLDSRGVVIGARMAKVAFKQYLRGTSGAPGGGNQSDFAVPFLGCGLSVAYSGGSPNEIGTWTPSVTQDLDDTSGTYCTVAVYNDGKEYKIHGAVGNLKLTFEVGKPVLAEYEFTGCLNTPTDVALLSPTYSSIVEPPFLGASLSVLGYTTAKIRTISVDLGRSITMRPFPNSVTGYFTAQAVSRNVRVTFDAEEELAATKNWWNEWLAGTLGSITTGVFPSNGSNYNQFNFTAPNLQYVKGSWGDRDGIRIASMEAIARANSDAGEDSISLVQT
jgi:hypothetical protein